MIEKQISAEELEQADIDPDYFLSVLSYSSPRVQRVAWDGDRGHVVVAFDGPAAQLDEILARIRDRLGGTVDIRPPKVFYRRGSRNLLSRRSAWDRLLREGLVWDLGRGQVAYRGRLLQLVEDLDRLLVRIADGFGAEHLHLPAMVPVAVLERLGAFDQYPHSLFFTAPLSRSIERIESYQDASDRADGPQVDRYLEAPGHGLKTSACCLVYPLHQSLNLSSARFYTVVGACVRHESRSAESLERLTEFQMREIIYVGDESGALEFEKACRSLLESLLESLDLGGEIATATDPFFIGNYRQYRQMQSLGHDKLEARLEPVGSQRGLAFASFNHHRTYFGRRFEISCRGQLATSACFGVGLERLALGLVTRHGLQWDKLAALVREAGKRRGAQS